MATYSNSHGIMMDIHDISRTPVPFKPYFLFSTILHTEVADLNENEGVMIAEMTVDRDYVNEQAEYIEIGLFIKPGTFMYDIYPYADDLELTLTRVKQERYNGLETKQFEERFKLIYLMDKNPNIPTTTELDKDTLNRQPPFMVMFQLVDRGTLAVRNSTVQGSFSDLISDKNKDMSASSIIKSLMSSVSAKVQVDNNPTISRVTIEKAHNEDPIKAIVIPTGTRALDLVNLMQEEKGGVYNSGAGSFVQFYAESPTSDVERVMFIYSLYDGSKYDRISEKLMFFVAPDGLATMVDRHYRYNARILRMIAAPINSLNSTKGAVLRSEGEGFRSGNFLDMLDLPFEFKDDGPRYKKKQMLTEITSKEQPDGLTYAPYTGLDKNHFVNASEILARSGEYVALNVSGVDHDYFYPAAPCLITYQLGNGMIDELIGVLHKTRTKYEFPTFDPSLEMTTLRHALMCKTNFVVYVTGPSNN